MASKASFNWADPLLLDQQLTDDERAVRDAAGVRRRRVALEATVDHDPAALRGLVRRGVERATERRISSAAAGDLFGPRRVRVRRGDPVPPDAGPPPPVRPVAAVEGEIVEGEIVR